MKYRFSSVLMVLAAFLCGYGYSHWLARDTVVSAKATRRILYYRCPMHPAVHAQQPGTTPCCHMAFEPVYAESAQALASGSILRVTPQQQQVMGIEYGTAEYTTGSRAIRAVARIGLNETKVARVQTKLDGFIDHLDVSRVGESVKAGQPLLTVFNRRSYTMAQMQFLQAAMEASGMGQLLPGVDLTQKRLSDAENLRLARVNLEMLGFTDEQIDAVSRAHQALTSLPLFSPIGGVIIEFNAALHQKLSMEPLMTIADLSTVWVTADFPAGDASSFRPGETARLTVPYLPGRQFQGKLDAVLPQFDADTHAVKVRFIFDNPGHALRPEMSGDIELRSGAGRRMLTVPREAVVDNGRSQTVFVALPDGYMRPQKVRAGEQLGDRLEILSGLKAGDRVVSSGNFLLDSEAELRSTR